LLYPVIADSWANFHIQGIGTVNCQVGYQKLVIPNVRYIPDLGESIYSLFQHIQSPDHGLHSSFEGGLTIIFPLFETKAVIGSHDIYLDVIPCTNSFIDLAAAPPQPDTTSPDLDNFCRHVTQLQQDILQETTYLDRLLSKLCSYYQEVKTKRQLGFDVPAGFRVASQQEQNLRAFVPPRKSLGPLPCYSIQEPVTQDQLFSVTEDMSSTSTALNSQSESIFIPIVRSVDKASTSLPKKVLMSEDSLRASLGFRRVDSIRRHFRNLYQDTIAFDPTPADAVLDPGDFATMHKTDCNTSPVPRPLAFGEMMHIDIVFGP
jgi:hypothetical protein